MIDGFGVAFQNAAGLELQIENVEDNQLRRNSTAASRCSNSCKSHPELSHGVDVLRFEKGVIVAVHQALPVDDSCVVHQHCNISNLK